MTRSVMSGPWSAAIGDVDGSLDKFDSQKRAPGGAL